MRVMPVIGFIFNMSSRDSDTTGPFFWGLIDRGVVMETGLSLRSENLGDSSSQSSLLCGFVSSCSGGETDCGAKPFRDRHVQWFLGKGQLIELSMRRRIKYSPMLTWGFFRSKLAIQRTEVRIGLETLHLESGDQEVN